VGATPLTGPGGDTPITLTGDFGNSHPIGAYLVGDTVDQIDGVISQMFVAPDGEPAIGPQGIGEYGWFTPGSAMPYGVLGSAVQDGLNMMQPGGAAAQWSGSPTSNTFGPQIFGQEGGGGNGQPVSSGTQPNAGGPGTNPGQAPSTDSNELRNSARNSGGGFWAGVKQFAIDHTPSITGIPSWVPFLGPVETKIKTWAIGTGVDNARAVVDGAIATGEQVVSEAGDVLEGNIGDAAQSQVAFSASYGSSSPLMRGLASQAIPVPIVGQLVADRAAEMASEVAQDMDSDAATRGKKAAPFLDTVATAMLGVAGRVAGFMTRGAAAAEGIVEATLAEGTIVDATLVEETIVEATLVEEALVEETLLDGSAITPKNVFPTKPGGTGAAYNEATGQGVYVLKNPTTGQIEYVGRGDAPRRLAEHAKLGSGKDDLVGEILFDNNLPAAQAESLEHELMQMLGGPKSVDPSTALRNKIQGIAENNATFVEKEFAAGDELVIEALRRAGLLPR
jgi:hypothetical protein